MNIPAAMLVTGSLFCAVFSVQSAPIKFAEDLPSWRKARIGCEKNDNFLRIGVEAKAKGNYGQLWKNIPAIPAGKYLQINVENMENADSFGWISTPDRGIKRRTFGMIFPGVNTYAPAISKRFNCSICLRGNRLKVGSWINFDSYEVSAAPENSLIAVKEPAEGDLKVGDTLNFKIFRKEKCKKPVQIRLFVTEHKKRDLRAVKFCKEEIINTVYNEAEKCYTASIKVDKEAYSLDSAKSQVYIVASAGLDGVDSYFTMPFDAKIVTAHKMPAAIFSADSPETRDNRQMWYNMVLGRKNLALKKPLRLTPKPNYHLTKDIANSKNKDAYDLTDGSITTRTSDKIWFYREAVGFFTDGKFRTNAAYLQLDMGSVQPVDYIAIRALGGAERGFRWPKKFEVFISRDGEKYFQSTELIKLEPAEGYQSDFIKTFYYPEFRKWQQSVCKSFKLHVNADARYVIVKVTLDTHFFSDEMAVIAAEKKNADFNKAYEGSGMKISLDGLTVQPRIPEIAIIKGLPAQQIFMVTDFRSDPAKIKKAHAVLDLPEPLTVHNYQAEKISVDGKKYNRYRLQMLADKRFKPIYIVSSSDISDQQPAAYMHMEYDGNTSARQSFPVKIVTLPEFKTFKKLPICLAWMTTETLFNAYPDLLKNHKRLGFNSVGIFPRYWIRSRKPNPSPEIDRCDAMRKAGYKIFMNESPMAIMGKGKKAGSEMFCQTGTPNTILCPSYMGKFYQQEMERVAKNVAMAKPDHVLLDIECYGRAFLISSVKCTRCLEAIKKSGLSTTEYMYSCGKRILKDLSAALAKGAETANIPMPQLHMYDLDRVDDQYSIFRFTDVYPEIIKSSQPSLYVGGHPAVVQKNIRENYKLLKEKNIMPWLSTGCYGEFDPHLVEPLVLEALMNGSGGILNYAYGYFDTPLDIYYHALAIMKLAPYEDLLIKGEIIDQKGSNGKMFYSTVKNGDEMLLLVGNYYKASPATSVELPYSKAEVSDLNTKKKFTSGKDFKFEVLPGKFSLFYIRKK